MEFFEFESFYCTELEHPKSRYVLDWVYVNGGFLQVVAVSMVGISIILTFQWLKPPHFGDNAHNHSTEIFL